MTVILVLFTFATFLLIDHFFSEKQVIVQPAVIAATATAKAEKAPRPVPGLVGGFGFRKISAIIPATPGR